MFKKLVLTVSLGAMMASFTSTSLFAGAVDQNGNYDRRYDSASVSPYGTVTYKPIFFASGEKAVVEVGGDGSTMVDLGVYDERGNLVVHYAGYSPWVSFVPNWTTGFYIKVHNLGPVSNNFTMRTN